HRVAGLDGLVLDFRRVDDQLDAIADALYGDVREARAEAPRVLGVEAGDQLADRVRGDRPVGHGDEGRLPALAPEAPVEATPHGRALGGLAGALAQAALH